MPATITQSRIFASLPEPIQAGILDYARRAGLSPFAVVTFAFSSLLCIDPVFQVEPMDRGGDLLCELPEDLERQVREAYLTIDPLMTVEDAVETAVTMALDLESMGYDDCLWPNRESLDLLLGAVGQVAA